MEIRKTDYHVHPDYSIDALPVKIRDYCRRALELDLDEICFTTHVEIDPVRKEKDNFVNLNGKLIPVLNHIWLDGYFNEINRAKDEFRNTGLVIKAGVEVGYCRGSEKDIEQITGNYPFDFVMGAIHCIDHIAISSIKESPNYFKNKSLDELKTDYFTILREAVDTGLFDCIAHVDLYHRYGFRHYGKKIFTVHRGAAEPVFKEMAKRGMGLEVNTSSRRRGLKEFHPTREMLELAAQCGIKVYTVGSDAHSPDEVGGYIDEALALLQELNLKNHVYTRRQAVAVN